MQPGRVGRRAKSAEHVALAFGRVGEQRQHFVAVRRDHHIVERHRRPIEKRERDLGRRPTNALQMGVDDDTIAERGGQFRDIALAAANDRFPLWLPLTDSNPWLSRKRINVSAGNALTESSELDQIADAIGYSYSRRNWSPNR